MADGRPIPVDTVHALSRPVLWPVAPDGECRRILYLRRKYRDARRWLVQLSTCAFAGRTSGAT